jgi:phosphoribosylaminoimidazolecarboxamide formyltransferase/IMP cyclohydrolase
MTDPAPWEPPDLVTPRRALLSVSDKTGLAALAAGLAERGVALVSTGGTARALREAGLDVTEVAEVTGLAEMMEGRVKTLHPAIHGGILGLRDRHGPEMEAHGIEGIDLVVVNLYPFEAALAAGTDGPALIEEIDVGGPAMLRAAAKNHAWVAPLCEPADYDAVLAEIDAQGGTRLATRRALAAKAFGRTARYDAAIAGWMGGERWVGGPALAPLRYGENPHQAAALHAGGTPRPGVATARALQGGALSYNNIADADAALEAVAEIAGDGPACVIVKHANPCGAAVAATGAEAHAGALAADRESAFGGIVAFSEPVDEAAARAVLEVFAEVVVAPGFSERAMAALAGKPRLRVLETPLPDPGAPGQVVRSVAGGLLVQDRDAGRATAADLSVATRRAPTETELADLLLAWRVCKHVRSNAIVLARGGAVVGVGPGQTSRVGSVRIACAKAGARAGGAALASDAFFPFADGLEAAAEAGVRAVVQPGGSKRDAEVVAAADAAGIAMVLTGMRHFRH